MKSMKRKSTKQKILERLEKYLWNSGEYKILACKKVKGHLYVFAHVKTYDEYNNTFEEIIGISNDGAVARSVISPLRYEYTNGGSVYRRAQEICWELARKHNLPVGKPQIKGA